MPALSRQPIAVIETACVNGPEYDWRPSMLGTVACAHHTSQLSNTVTHPFGAREISRSSTSLRYALYGCWLAYADSANFCGCELPPLRQHHFSDMLVPFAELLADYRMHNTW